MVIANPFHFHDTLEMYGDDEAETIAGLNATFDKILETTAKDYGHAVCSVHAKAHGILQGTLTVAAREFAYKALLQQVRFKGYLRSE